MKLKLKSYFPKGLYGRAALIVLLPVLLLQILFTVEFVQRHYEGVTRSMSRVVLRELQTVFAGPAPDIALASALNISVAPADSIPDENQSVFWDLPGRTMLDVLTPGLPGLAAYDLSADVQISLWINTPTGPYQATFSRSQIRAANPHQLLVLMTVMGIILTAIAIIFLRNQLRPIRKLARASSDYGKGRITPYSPSGASEIRAAGTAFLEMRMRIERQIQSRTLMLSGISHDLRTPLTRLRLGLSMLDDPDSAALLQDVDEMEQLVNTVLDYGKIDTTDTAEPANIAALIHETVAHFPAPITLVPLPEGLEIPVRFRPLAVKRALLNLIGNAERYGNGAICVSAELSAKSVIISVHDNGPGIAPEQREDAVRPFTRLDPSRNQNTGAGVGLGLAIVADIARLHGGSLRLDTSQPLGGLRADLILAK